MSEEVRLTGMNVWLFGESSDPTRSHVGSCPVCQNRMGTSPYVTIGRWDTPAMLAAVIHVECLQHLAQTAVTRLVLEKLSK